MTDQGPSTGEELRRVLTERSNWGRWGADDQVGAMNLISPEKRKWAVGVVTSGRTVSLSRLFPKQPGPLCVHDHGSAAAGGRGHGESRQPYRHVLGF